MNIEGSVFEFFSDRSSRGLEIPQGNMLEIYDGIILKKMNVIANQYGLYSFANFQGRDKKRIATLTLPKHVLQRATNCKTWNPKGRLRLEGAEMIASRVEFDGEQCVDELFGDCLEYLLGGGNNAYDMAATEKGRQLLDAMLGRITDALSNSIYDLVTFANHPTIDTSDSNAYWDTGKTEEQEWLDFVDQQGAVDFKGHVALIDEAKTDGLDHFNVQIPDGDFDGTKTKYEGDAIALIQEVIDSAPTKFRLAIKNQLQGFPAIILVTRSIFSRLKTQLIDDYTGIDAPYQLLITNNGIQRPIPGALQLDGKLVLCWDEMDHFNELTGTVSHRVVMTAPGNMVVGYDTDNLDGIAGGGLLVEQSPRIREKKRIDMFTAFKTGAAIANTDFMVNASADFTPSS